MVNGISKYMYCTVVHIVYCNHIHVAETKTEIAAKGGLTALSGTPFVPIRPSTFVPAAKTPNKSSYGVP